MNDKTDLAMQLINRFADLKLGRDRQMDIIQLALNGDAATIHEMDAKQIQKVLDSEILAEVEYEELRMRLINGAEHLENSPKGTAQYEKAARLYAELERRLAECKKRMTLMQS